LLNTVVLRANVAATSSASELKGDKPNSGSLSARNAWEVSTDDAYTFSELERMFSNAGFARSEIHPLPPSIEQVVISHK